MSYQLKGVFLFEHVYLLFGSGDDSEIISKFGIFAIAYTVFLSGLGWFMPAPYGKYLAGPSKLVVNAKLSWMLQEMPAFLVPLFLLLKSPAAQMRNWPNQIAITLFMAHYFHRSFIYPLRVSRQANPVPLWITLSAFLFCGWNGFWQGHHLINVTSVSTDSILIWPGVFLFVSGMLINVYHDGLLIKLGDNKSASPSTSAEARNRYKIPRGGLFQLISGANYFGEIVEWWGFALITRQFPQILFAVFTTQFLAHRAVHNHKYYRQTYGDAYPPDRKAIIPYIL